MNILTKNQKRVAVLGYTTCTCGAIAIHTDCGTYNCKRSKLRDSFPGLDLRSVKRDGPELYCCDHCVNHYGLDLCGCGSGEPVGLCDEDLDICHKKRPMQVVGEYTRIVANGAFV